MNVVHSQYVCSAFRAYTKVNGYAYPAGNIRAAVHNFLYQHGPNSEQRQKEMWGCHWPGQHRRKRVSFMIVPHWLLHIKLNKVYLFQSCEGPMCLKSLRLELLICSLTSKLQINQKQGGKRGLVNASLMPLSPSRPRDAGMASLVQKKLLQLSLMLVSQQMASFSKRFLFWQYLALNTYQLIRSACRDTFGPVLILCPFLLSPAFQIAIQACLLWQRLQEKKKKKVSMKRKNPLGKASWVLKGP